MQTREHGCRRTVSKSSNISLVLEGVHTARGEWHGKSDTSSLCGALNGGVATKDNEISKRYLLAACRILGLDSFQLKRVLVLVKSR